MLNGLLIRFFFFLFFWNCSLMLVFTLLTMVWLLCLSLTKWILQALMCFWSLSKCCSTWHEFRVWQIRYQFPRRSCCVSAIPYGKSRYKISVWVYILIDVSMYRLRSRAVCSWHILRKLFTSGCWVIICVSGMYSMRWTFYSGSN